MFRLIRTAILVVIAFAVGIVYEQSRARGLCAAADGNWHAGVCVGSDIPND